MFVRVKKSGNYQYLQIVHNQRSGGQVRQRVLGTLGRLDLLQASGQLDGLLASCARFAQHSAVLSAEREDRLKPLRRVRIGPPLVFERLWQQLGLPQVLGRLLADRKFEFDVERAVPRGAIGRPNAGKAAMRSPAWRDFGCITFIGRWPGWASPCPKTSRPMPRPLLLGV